MKKSFLFLLCFLFLLVLSFTISFAIPKKINIFNKSFSLTTTIIDLSDIKIDYDNTEWFSKLRDFKELKKLVLGENTLPLEDKKRLIDMYPNVEIQVVGIINIYGMEIKENVTSIDFSNINIDDDIVQKLLLFPNLNYVSFGNTKLDFKLQLLLTEKYPDIHFEWEVMLNKQWISSNIESLDFSNAHIDSYDDFSQALALLPNVKSLDMTNTNLSNEELGLLRQKYPQIEINWVVYFGQWSMRTDRVAFSVLITNFNYKRLTSDDIQVLKYCNKLQALDLGHQAIDDISVIADNMPELRLLILADNKITDITSLSKLKKLHYLELFMNNITDLTPLAQLDGLVDLNISYNNKLSDITPILNLPKLERLWLVHCRISNDNYRLLRSTYPNTIVSSEGVGSTDGGWRTHPRYRAYVDMFRKNYMSELFLIYD